MRLDVQIMYEKMKMGVENVMEKGEVGNEFINNGNEEHLAFLKWTKSFTSHNHPAIIEVRHSAIHTCLVKYKKSTFTCHFLYQLFMCVSFVNNSPSLINITFIRNFIFSFSILLHVITIRWFTTFHW